MTRKRLKEIIKWARDLAPSAAKDVIGELILHIGIKDSDLRSIAKQRDRAEDSRQEIQQYLF